MLKSSISLAFAILVGTSLYVHAGPIQTDSKDYKNKNVIQQPVEDPKWWVDAGAGGEFDESSDRFLKESDFSVGTAANPLTGNLRGKSFSTTHDPVTNARLEVGYKVLPYLSVFAGFTYSFAYGEGEVPVGSVKDPTGFYGGIPGGKYNVYGNFHQYKAYTGMAGIKLNMPRTILDLIHAPKCISPYFSLSAGGKNIDDQRAQFYAKNGRIFSTNYLLLYDNSLVFTGEANLGYDVKLTRNFDITLESGYGYDTVPDHDQIAGIHHTNKDGDRLYSTVTLGAKYKF